MREIAIPNADPLYIDLYWLLKSAYINLRKQLLHSINTNPGGARRQMWVLERKFKEWNIKWEPPQDNSDNDLEGPIEEELMQYPTYIGTYHDPEHAERPKDISPVNHAVYQGYVIPNPDYEGEEDDTTRAIAGMWQMLQEQRMEEAERHALLERKRAERLAKQAEEQQLLQERQAGARPPSLPEESDYDAERRYKREAREKERLLAKINSKGRGFHEPPPVEEEWDLVGDN